MSPVRVLRIQSRICVGGPALNTILLSAHMDATRFQTILVGGRLDPGEKSMQPLAEKKGVTLRIIDEMGRAVHWWDDLKALFALMKLIREVRPHIVHTHTAKAGAVGRVAAFLCRVPVRVHTFHGHVFHGYFSRPVTIAYIWIEKILAALSTRIVTISPAQEYDLTRRYKVVPARKNTVIRLGFELDKMVGGTKGKLREELNLGPEIRLAAIVARLVPIKNVQLLIRAIGHWHADRKPGTPEVRFLVVGDGEEREALKNLAAELGIRDLVIFLGWRGDVPDIYADIDLNILVSKNEGTPVTLIEGLACGVPILTTDVGGIRDFADHDCGRIVPADITPEALAKHLAEALSGNQRRLAPEVTDRIRRTFHVNRLVSDMEALYTDLLNG
ncbi:MAG: glycosyltransferase [Acidobacteriota bacterium]|nr:glycosyltransferase [Acidobacteriota bacterium]